MAARKPKPQPEEAPKEAPQGSTDRADKAPQKTVRPDGLVTIDY